MFGYAEYSNWFINGAGQRQFELRRRAPGLRSARQYVRRDGRLSNQLNDKNLLTATASYQTQKLETYSGDTFGTIDTNLVDKKGNCYNPATGGFASCFTSIYNPDGSLNPSGGLNQYNQYGAPITGNPLRRRLRPRSPRRPVRPRSPTARSGS